MIQCSYPLAQYQAHKDAIDAAIRRTLDSGWYILGEEVAAFETEFARYCGSSYGIGVASGTEAITLALMGMGVGRSDEVITVSHTAVATVSAIEQAGAMPVLVDVDPITLTMNAGELEAAVSPATKAIVVVHLYGQPADMDAILAFSRARNIRVIEDCAQAHGATYRGKRVGSMSDAGCFSFFPTKNLGALGDGGGIVTSDAEVARRIRHLREYGWEPRPISVSPGINSRLDTLQAAVLRVKLPHLDADNAARARIAETYRHELRDLPLVMPAKVADTTHVFHQLVVRSEKRDALLAHLRSKNINPGLHYPQAVHQQPAYRDLPHRSRFRVTDEIIPRILSLPIYPELSEADLKSVIGALRSFKHG